ncbi:hypothetical protein ACFFWC_28130 [Plantactinospora siamensis]|uniref:Excreted virulence factor EspC, type VII ESX diderm n=1 Tax=Plantactinospora siamensis TaxID=555372 RepID=A0ABV6NQ52_9ACTN
MSGDKWLADGNVEVDIHQLQDFAKHIKDELEKNFRPSFENGIAPMLRVQPPFGGGGLSEGKFFRVEHDKSRAAAQALLHEAQAGLMSLSAVAMSIAAEYLDGDAFAQAKSDQVYDALNAAPPPPATNGDGKDGKDGKGDTVDVSADKKDPSKYFGPNSGDQGGTTPGQGDQQVIGKGDGQYVIPADQEHMDDPSLAMPKIEH